MFFLSARRWPKGKKVVSYLGAVACLWVLPALVSGQDDADTTKDTTVQVFHIPVTYRDYHGDGSNPEFQILDPKRLFSSELILDELDIEGYPVRNPELITREGVPQSISDINPPLIIDSTIWMQYLIYNLDNWWRDWTPGRTVTRIIPADTASTFEYDSSKADTIINMWGDTNIVYKGIERIVITPADTLTSDTMFKSVRVDDSLPLYKFNYVRSQLTGYDGVTSQPVYKRTIYENCYRFDRQGYDKHGFFPLQAKGFQTAADTIFDPENPGPGNSTTPQIGVLNGNFTTEIRNTFMYKPGQFLEVGGDDDTYVFVNGKRIFNSPGFHLVEKSWIDLDSLDNLDLVEGQSCSFALFHAERCVGASGLYILTNIEFVDMTAAGDTVIKVTPIQSPHAIRSTSRSYVPLNFGKISLQVPRGTDIIGITMFDAGGRQIVQVKDALSQDGVLRADDMLKKLPHGIYILSVKCSTAQGIQLGTYSRTVAVMR